uniref:Putative secreted protein n=1 Tax=Ixodes ricinus TaxID=34613 RepID=A0A6B0UAD9_IXORI
MQMPATQTPVVSACVASARAVSCTDLRTLTFAEKFSRVASIRLPVIVAKPNAMSSRIENCSHEDATNVVLTTPPKQPQTWSWGCWGSWE